MSNTMSLDERRRTAMAALFHGGMVMGPMALGIGLSYSNIFVRLFMLGFSAFLFSGVVRYWLNYGLRLTPLWKWQIWSGDLPEFSYTMSYGWGLRLIGVVGLFMGIFIASLPFYRLASTPWDASRSPGLIGMLWFGGWLIVMGACIALETFGVYIFKERRTVTAWWGFAWPMFRKEFRFERFTDTSIHLIVPREWFRRRYWCVWLREASNSIWIHARNRDDAKRIAIQLADVIGVKYWPPPDEAQDTKSIEPPI